MSVYGLLKCPLCGGDLETDGKSLICTGRARRHLYDFAATGYVNLLPPGKGKNARTGDDKQMISARARFLDKGYYSFFSEKIGKVISAFAKDGSKAGIVLADCACGEGYHTCNILKTIAENGVTPHAVAFDASKHGASYGSRRASRIPGTDAFFAAANIFDLPLKDGCADFATSIFAPVAWDEMRRILKGDGVLIVASSGERHLYELRELLYDEPREASGEVKHPSFFEEAGCETVSRHVRVEGNGTVKDLFFMTPFCYRTSREDFEKLSSVDALDVTVEVKLTYFRKPSQSDGEGQSV